MSTMESFAKTMAPKTAKPIIPDVLLEMVFAFLDEKSVEAAEQVSPEWDGVISSSILVWKSLLIKLCKLKPNYAMILNSKVYIDRKQNGGKLKQLYYKMNMIENNVKNNRFRVKTLDNGIGNRNVSSTHVADDKKLVSVPKYGMGMKFRERDTIQVWNLSTNELVHVIPASILEDDEGAIYDLYMFPVIDEEIRYYHLRGDILYSCNVNGWLVLLNVVTGQILQKVRHTNESFGAISNMAGSGDSLVTVDHHNRKIIEWKVQEDGRVVELLGQERFVLPEREYLSSSMLGRGLCYSGDYCVISCGNRLVCFKNGDVRVIGITDERVCNIAIRGDLLAFFDYIGTTILLPKTCSQIPSTRKALGICDLSQETASGILYLKLSDKVNFWDQRDESMSFCFFANHLILGDDLGRVYLVDISQIQFPPPGDKRVIQIGTENDYGVIVIGTHKFHQYGIALSEVDAYRFVSMEEDGKVVVRDYMMADSGDATNISEVGRKLSNTWVALSEDSTTSRRCVISGRLRGAVSYQASASLKLVKGDIEAAKDAIVKSISLWLPQYIRMLEDGGDVKCELDSDIRLEAAKILMQVEDMDNAVAVLEGLVKENGEELEAWYLLGWISHLKEEWTKARFFLKKTKQINSINPADDKGIVEHMEELLAKIAIEEQEDIGRKNDSVPSETSGKGATAKEEEKDGEKAKLADEEDVSEATELGDEEEGKFGKKEDGEKGR